MIEHRRRRLLVLFGLGFSAALIFALVCFNYSKVKDVVLAHNPLAPQSKKPSPRRKEPLPPPSPIEDNFPQAATARSPHDLPPIPSWNKPRQFSEPTPLFIGFTRNWRVLQQAVVSYITSGWPPEQIYVVDNTGTFDSNRKGLLTPQNPFYLDQRRLTEVFGVNVITAPTLMSFAQLQNFFLFTAMERKWAQYFWSHQDVLALANERVKPYDSLYHRAVAVLRESVDPAFGKWGIRFFAYDHLALVNAEAFMAVGAWDTFIPYYGTDCDMHDRLDMEGYKLSDAKAGLIFDVGSTLPDLRVLYREDDAANRAMCAEDAPEDTLAFGLGDCRHEALIKQAEQFAHLKNTRKEGRNFWQGEQMGGQGEPFYRDPLGFEQSVYMTIEYGRDIMGEKWGHNGCGFKHAGLDTDDQWRVQHEAGFQKPGNRPFHGCK